MSGAQFDAAGYDAWSATDGRPDIYIPGPGEGRNSYRTKKEESRSDAGPPPVLDRAMFAGLLGEIVEAAEPTTEADPVGVYASLLAGIGVLIGSTPYVQVGNTRHPLLVWPLLFGRTGSGRKGEATGTAVRLLRSTEFEFSGYSVTGLSSGEGLIERLRDPDPTNEKDTGGTSDKRLFVVEPEFSSVMARARRDGNTLAGVLREGWDGGALGLLNRKAVRASASHIAVVGHITPREFRLRLAEGEMAGGTYNRFLPLYVERSKPLPIPIGMTEQTVSNLGERLARAAREARKIQRIQMGPEAAELWKAKLYDEFTASDDEDQAWTEFTRRTAPYCLRVGALLAVMDGRKLISVGDLEAAAALIRYAVASAKHVLDRTARDPRMDRIRRRIDGSREGLTKTEVSALFSRNLPAKVIEELLADLLATGEYEEIQAATGGRPATRYRRLTEVSSFFVPSERAGTAS